MTYDVTIPDGYHDNSKDNFKGALMAIDGKPLHVPSSFNIWMNIQVSPEGSYTWEALASKAGDKIVLKALTNCIAIMFSCPQDMAPVNNIGVKPSELSSNVEDRNMSQKDTS